MIYVPRDTTYDKCYVIQSEGVIRGYDVYPRNNISYNYRDYYIRSDYIHRDGQGTWSNYTTLPTCLSDTDITNNYWYRLDISNVLIMFLIINIFGIFLPIKIFSKLFRKGGL